MDVDSTMKNGTGVLKSEGNEKCYADFSHGAEYYTPPAGYGQLQKTDVTTRAPAGKPHNAPEKGAGSWVLQTEWKIGANEEPTDYQSELQSSYQDYPGYQRAKASEKARLSTFPAPKDEIEYVTGHQRDFPGSEPQPTRFPYRPGPSTVGDQHPILGGGAPIGSSYKDQFAQRSGEGIVAAGLPRADPCGYNIVTGAGPLVDNPSNYEYPREGHHMNRHRS